MIYVKKDLQIEIRKNCLFVRHCNQMAILFFHHLAIYVPQWKFAQ